MIRVLFAAIVCFAISPGSAADPPKPPEPIVLHVGMTATTDGELQALLFEGKPIAVPADKKRTRFDELTSIIRKEMGTPPGRDPKRFEVEIDAADDLKYEHIISAISAVSACLPEGGGEPRPLVSKVRFKPEDDARPDPGFELKLPKTP
jgi:hypothetical protein